MAGTQKWILSQSLNVVSSVILKIAMHVRLSNIDREFFKKALTKRMVGRTGVLSQSSRALSAMSAQEMDDIADIARDQLREHLRGYESRSDKGK